jgi:hypothetical protein
MLRIDGHLGYCLLLFTTREENLIPTQVSSVRKAVVIFENISYSFTSTQPRNVQILCKIVKNLTKETPVQKRNADPPSNAGGEVAV